MNPLWKRLRSYWREHVSVPLYSPQARQDPYPYYEKLREAAPVHCLRDRRYWTVSHYEDVRHVLSHPDLYPSTGVGQLEKSLSGADDPGHARVRKIVSRAFSANHLASLEGRIRDVAEEFVDNIAGRGQCDFVDDLAKPLPLRVMAMLLDLDPDRWRDYSRWTDAAVVDDKEALGADAKDAIEMDLAEMTAFLEDHLIECRQGRRQGVCCTEVIPDLTDEEARDVLKLLLTAGNVTTSHLLGNLAVVLLQNPEVMHALRADPELIPTVIEETLRINTPTLSVPRRPAKDVTLDGQPIPANSVMFVLLGSANHDDEKFPDANRFSLERDTRGHLAFGSGLHYCLGAALSRLEAKIVLETLLERLEVIEAAEPLDQIRWEENMHLRGPKRLKLNVRAFPGN